MEWLQVEQAVLKGCHSCSVVFGLTSCSGRFFQGATLQQLWGHSLGYTQANRLMTLSDHIGLNWTTFVPKLIPLPRVSCAVLALLELFFLSGGSISGYNAYLVTELFPGRHIHSLQIAIHNRSKYGYHQSIKSITKSNLVNQRVL